MKQEHKNRIKSFLDNVEFNNSIWDYINIDDLNYDDLDIDEFYNLLNDAGFFNVEIIYYINAIKYLMENDASLEDALQIADNFGYELIDLNSEILASLLASEYEREKFDDISSKLDDLFNEIKEENKLEYI